MSHTSKQDRFLEALLTMHSEGAMSLADCLRHAYMAGVRAGERVDRTLQLQNGAQMQSAATFYPPPGKVGGTLQGKVDIGAEFNAQRESQQEYLGVERR